VVNVKILCHLLHFFAPKWDKVDEGHTNDCVKHTAYPSVRTQNKFQNSENSFKQNK